MDDFTDGITITFWAKPTAVQAWSRVFDFGNGFSTDNILLAQDGTSGHVTFFTYYDTSGAVSVTDESGFALNEWHYYTLTADTEGTLKIYRDGVLDAEEPESGHTLDDIVRTNNFLGKSDLDGDPFYKGYLDDMRIYNRALGASEVTNLSAGREVDDGGATVPDAPVLSSATAEDEDVVLEYTQPSDGGSDITGFQIEYSVHGEDDWTRLSELATGTTATVKDLDNGTNYDFRVRAVNDIGESDPSNVLTAMPVALQLSDLISWGSLSTDNITETGATLVGHIDMSALLDHFDITDEADVSEFYESLISYNGVELFLGFVLSDNETIELMEDMPVLADAFEAPNDFSATLDGTLTCGTTYAFAPVFATIGLGFAFDPEVKTSFTTSACGGEDSPAPASHARKSGHSGRNIFGLINPQPGNPELPPVFIAPEQRAPQGDTALPVRDLSIGMSGDDVKALQLLLVATAWCAGARRNSSRRRAGRRRCRPRRRLLRAGGARRAHPFQIQG
ncbi:MAG: LamG-like jellyroll fold domain-containing protein [bacterium]